MIIRFIVQIIISFFRYDTESAFLMQFQRSGILFINTAGKPELNGPVSFNASVTPESRMAPYPFLLESGRVSSASIQYSPS